MKHFHRSRYLTCLTYLALALSVSGGLACQRAETATPKNVAQAESRPAQEGLESLTTILRTSDADLDKPQRVVIRDSLAWTRMWGTLVGRHLTPPAVPHLAFDSSLVIVAAAGTSGSGHVIRIDSVNMQNGELVIHVLESHPAPGCIGNMMVTSPAHAVRTGRIAASERFVNRRVVQECRHQ